MESCRKIESITWSEVRDRMVKAGIKAVVPMTLITYFEDSELKFYGYGSRFNGSTPRDNSDWDMLVVCTDDEWKQLIDRIDSDLGFSLMLWSCGRWKGYKPEQPVFGNYRPSFGGKNAINVRKYRKS